MIERMGEDVTLHRWQYKLNEQNQSLEKTRESTETLTNNNQTGQSPP